MIVRFKKRGVHWTYLYTFLLVLSIWIVADAAVTPILSHDDPANEREFVSVYQNITNPQISTGVAQNFTIINGTAQNFSITSASATFTYWVPPVYSSVTIASVQSTLTTSSSTTTTIFVPTGLTATIVPKFSTSRIKISATGTLAAVTTIQKECLGSISRGTTDLSNGNGFGTVGEGGVATALEVPFAVTYIDSPGTTSSISYNVTIRTDLAADACTFNEIGGKAVLILEEIR